MLIQLVIFLSSLGFVLCVVFGKDGAWTLAGFVIALLGQPAWFWTAWQTHQLGILASATIFTIVYCYGIADYWIARSRRKPRI